MLPSLSVPVVGMLAKRRIRSVSGIAFNSSTNATSITIPSLTQQGDLLVGMDWAQGVSAPPFVQWNGFTLVRNQASSAVRIATFVKIADENDAGRAVSGISSSTAREKRIAVLRFNVPLKSTSLYHVEQSSITSGNPAPIVINSDNVPSITIGMYATRSGDINTYTFDPAPDGAYGVGAEIVVAWKLFTKSPQSVTIDMGDNGFSNYQLGMNLILFI